MCTCAWSERVREKKERARQRGRDRDRERERERICDREREREIERDCENVLYVPKTNILLLFICLFICLCFNCGAAESLKSPRLVLFRLTSLSLPR